MSYITRSGVAHVLDESPHRLIIEYGTDDALMYVFSSELYLTIFKKKMEEHRDYHNSSLTKRFGFEIKNDKLCDIKLYSKTEKRGFLIIGKEEYKCLNTIRLDGVNLMSKS